MLFRQERRLHPSPYSFLFLVVKHAVVNGVEVAHSATKESNSATRHCRELNAAYTVEIVNGLAAFVAVQFPLNSRVIQFLSICGFRAEQGSRF
jgi:hypothetical protein